MKRLHKILSVFAILFIMTGAVFGTVPAKAADGETEYIPTWKEYKKAMGITESTWNHLVEGIDLVLDASYELYKLGDEASKDAAYDAINDAYYGYYELMERAVMSYISGARVSEVELQFKMCKMAIQKDDTLDALAAEIQELKDINHYDANVLDGVGNEDTSKGANILAFLGSFGILVREGLEAILVISAIIAYLIKSDNADKRHVVYIGCGVGIIASIILAVIFNQFRIANTASQEIFEGAAALLAVVVLFFTCNWMISKAESVTWNKYIESKVQTSANGGKLFALAFTAFLAVFREGAEVVLFFQPYFATDSSIEIKYVFFGIGAAVVVLAVIFVLIRFVSVKLPLKPFFMATSILMSLMAVAFLGSGIKELIEGDIIPAHEILTNIIPYNSVLDVLGIYPIIETLVPQLILLAIFVVTFIIQAKKNKKLALESKS